MYLILTLLFALPTCPSFEGFDVLSTGQQGIHMFQVVTNVFCDNLSQQRSCFKEESEGNVCVGTHSLGTVKDVAMHVVTTLAQEKENVIRRITDVAQCCHLLQRETQ